MNGSVCLKNRAGIQRINPVFPTNRNKYGNSERFFTEEMRMTFSVSMILAISVAINPPNESPIKMGFLPVSFRAILQRILFDRFLFLRRQPWHKNGFKTREI